jgi:hypothetical protein
VLLSAAVSAGAAVIAVEEELPQPVIINAAITPAAIIAIDFFIFVSSLSYSTTLL